MSTVLGLSSVLAQTTVTNYPVTNDTFVRSSAANNSFGYSPNVIVGGWGDMTIGMVKPANFASLPVLATGDKAELWLYNTVSGYSPTQIQVGLAGLPWSEYNTWNSGLSWYPTSVVTANISAPGYWTAIDVTASYNMAKSGQALYYGWYLVPINTNGQFNFFASAEHSNTAWRPFVRVTKVSQVVVDPYRFLSFPLKVTGFTDWKTAPITSVMDHSKTSTLLSNQNGVVMTWSGLTASKLSNATTDTTCRGFDTVDTITSISHLNGVNVPYVGASSCGKGKTLSYDGHTGIDYAAPNGTPCLCCSRWCGDRDGV